LFGVSFLLDGARAVLLVGGAVAAVVGVLAYRQMHDRRAESAGPSTPMLPDLLGVLRRGEPRDGTGVLVTVEGAATASHASLLADRLRAEGHIVVELDDGEADRARWSTATREASLSGRRAKALAAAAVRADQVERVIRPALASGAIVVVDRFLTGPLMQVLEGQSGAGLDAIEVEGLAAWATGRLRPDVSVLLDSPQVAPPATDPVEHVRVQRLLTHMAALEPHRYVVIDVGLDPGAEDVPERMIDGLRPLLPPVATSGAEVPAE
ncbi:MAG: MFS transporter, partial [Pseudonocardia sp.]|nr:MFS transporter [Pseudonocardia sp.]